MYCADISVRREHAEHLPDRIGSAGSVATILGVWSVGIVLQPPRTLHELPSVFLEWVLVVSVESGGVRREVEPRAIFETFPVEGDGLEPRLVA